MTKEQNNTANLKTSYGINLKLSLVIVLLIMIGVLVSFPKIDKSNDRITTPPVRIFDKVIDVQITKIDIPEPQKPERPKIPIFKPDEPVDEGLIDYSIFENPPIIDGPPIFEELPTPEVPTIPMHLVQQPPEPLNGYPDIQRRVVYPEIAQEAGIEGMVFIKALIDEHGDVIECSVAKGVPNTGLDEAAIKAIINTKFTPAMQRDRAVRVYITIPIVFALR